MKNEECILLYLMKARMSGCTMMAANVCKYCNHQLGTWWHVREMFGFSCHFSSFFNTVDFFRLFWYQQTHKTRNMTAHRCAKSTVITQYFPVWRYLLQYHPVCNHHIGGIMVR
jgi:hypothetical protein